LLIAVYNAHKRAFTFLGRITRFFDFDGLVGDFRGMFFGFVSTKFEFVWMEVYFGGDAKATVQCLAAPQAKI